MARKKELATNQKVKFRRSHDKTVELTGIIVGISPDEDVVQIKTIPDGKIVEVESLETVHVADVTTLDDEEAEEEKESA